MLTRIKAVARKTLRRLGYEIVPTKAALPKEVRNDYEAVIDRIGGYSFKFLDIKTFVPIMLKRAHLLGLHESQPLDILDIGTGVGFFPVVAEYYGHRVVSFDRDGNQVFRDVTKWLGIDRRTWEISARVPLPSFDRRFNLITAFMVNFDRDRNEVAWPREDWEFFLRDLVENHLAPGGRIALLLNPHTRDNKDVMDYFREQSTNVDRDSLWVTFKPGCKLFERFRS